ncbi:hypothetical protein TRFO_07623 [Tritrichomonas foetus]|uniref:Mid2 domain-containing protein n=1 Tax=Tritrichomonas foetus TaxID=1144522 RepID=A0A1J4JQQ8_9EUKA|nr:hypothetical protein TRFO_07623 [Tritrichomonas foetus]|eukprot:OHT01371.1 hypothetical protein TRFO_07623 [Tritrichomonas foetus]
MAFSFSSSLIDQILSFLSQESIQKETQFPTLCQSNTQTISIDSISRSIDSHMSISEGITDEEKDNPNVNAESSDKQSLDAGSIAGITAGIVAVIAVIAIISYFAFRKKKMNSSNHEIDESVETYSPTMGSVTSINPLFEKDCMLTSSDPFGDDFAENNDAGNFIL